MAHRLLVIVCGLLWPVLPVDSITATSQAQVEIPADAVVICLGDSLTWHGSKSPTGYVNLLAVALIIPVTLLVAPYGVQLAHRMSKKALSVGFGLFLLIVSVRFAWTLF